MVKQRLDLPEGTLDLLTSRPWLSNPSTVGPFPSVFSRFRVMSNASRKARSTRLSYPGPGLATVLTTESTEEHGTMDGAN